MELIKKINIVLISLFLIGLSLFMFIFYRTNFGNAKGEVINQAKLMLKTAFAVREYTTSEIEPILKFRNKLINLWFIVIIKFR